jgi:hypothetical protein
MYKNLREVVNQYAGHPWFMENYSNIIFELNHLELHFLDDYLFNLYMDEVSIDENPNNSNIAYLIGITSKEPVRPELRQLVVAFPMWIATLNSLDVMMCLHI